jgi:serine/threonine-protein kinase
VVYAAVDVATGAEVAVKVLLPHLLAVPSVRERFLREARLGLAIAHPNVVRAVDVGSVEVDHADDIRAELERVRSAE